jgi:serine/threonine protein phosphatase PrpC
VSSHLSVLLLLHRQARNCTNNGNVLAKAAAQAVMEAALHKGSTDNITVVAMLMDWGCEYDEDS